MKVHIRTRKSEILCNGVVDCSSLPHLQVRSAESYSPNHLYSHTLIKRMIIMEVTLVSYISMSDFDGNLLKKLTGTDGSLLLKRG